MFIIIDNKYVNHFETPFYKNFFYSLITTHDNGWFSLRLKAFFTDKP
ncbi:hypothetical protein CHCC14559_1225 [Bacillus licheniformis]|nr:hypothetical protein CHCC20339_2089 [Bacillus licheniformis]TWN29177.1 hypothetical protein CHCC14559_1225 [Bacillus licheniformis]TWN43585.1 hypothetical protein CHCC14441_2649 [Bacillus licheniformis]TWN45361.1 hypothetical protein CHCC14525_1299 [Bacillus licheniformis]TWN48511.1 hypothetical protein CHCC14437_1050 [Bacillus licheniformis]